MWPLGFLGNRVLHGLLLPISDTKIDPSLHERQRLLKRARLVDDLNDKLIHRPGPLDLMKGNILKTDDEKLMEAIQGSLMFYCRRERTRSNTIRLTCFIVNSMSFGFQCSLFYKL